MHNFIESPICSGSERLKNHKHPTQKPISILKRMIEMASNEDDIIFDPFMGVGSTGVAAMQLNRRFIGVELDPEYCQAGKIRIETELEELMHRRNKSVRYPVFEESPTMTRDDSEIYYTSLDELYQFIKH